MDETEFDLKKFDVSKGCHWKRAEVSSDTEKELKLLGKQGRKKLILGTQSFYFLSGIPFKGFTCGE